MRLELDLSYLEPLLLIKGCRGKLSGVWLSFWMLLLGLFFQEFEELLRKVIVLGVFVLG